MGTVSMFRRAGFKRIRGAITGIPRYYTPRSQLRRRPGGSTRDPDTERSSHDQQEQAQAIQGRGYQAARRAKSQNHSGDSDADDGTGCKTAEALTTCGSKPPQDEDHRDKNEDRSVENLTEVGVVRAAALAQP